MQHKGEDVGVINKLNFKRVIPAENRVSRDMDGKLHSHPCVLDSGNPCRNDDPAAWVSGSVTQQPKQPDAGLRLTPNPTYPANHPSPNPLPGGEGVIKASLHALTKAALVLPGLLSPVAYAAEGDEVDFQYSHYQEGKRDISIDSGEGMIGIKSFNPIEVDSLHGGARISLTDRIKFAFNYVQDTWGGATPVATTPYLFSGNRELTNSSGVITGATPLLAGNSLVVDANFNPLINPLTGSSIYRKTADSTKLTHIMATASPETRKQGDFKLSYDWDNAGLSVGGGISVEDDYDSRFGNIGGHLDFNQKCTVLNADLSYTNSYTHATAEHYNFVYYDFVPKNRLYNPDGTEGWNVIQGTKQDWATHLGLTQVLNKDAVVGVDFSYTRSTGYLSNPYKGVSVLFVNPDPLAVQNLFPDAPDGSLLGEMRTFVERRPDVRNQYGVGGRYVQYINSLDAALHFNYQFSADDWGIQAHTFDADWVQPLGGGWIVTPRIRYYSQDAATFYTPYLIQNQALVKKELDPITGIPIMLGSDGKTYHFDLAKGNFVDSQGNVSPSSVSMNEKTTPFDPKKIPAYFSSDHRLSGFGTLSGGVTIAKEFAKGLTLETGFEYYTHQGGLKIGGGGEGAYANFDYWLANAALKVNLEALSLGSGSSGNSEYTNHSYHDHGMHGPAGVMFDHMLPAGKFMVGYRYMWNSQGGGMLNGDSSVSDSSIIANGCKEPGGEGCFLSPRSMSMSMHMLDLMYAPTDWLTLMLMPQFVDMGMDSMWPLSRSINGTSVDSHSLGGHYTHHIQNGHESGGIGDLGMYALFKVFDNGTHHLHATAGLSAPTGDVNIQIRRTHALDGGFMDYGMQLGSGTWDFKPSLTYTGHLDDFSWGAQASGIIRMEDKNDSGYRLGDLFQTTAWGGYNLTNWLTASVRGMYTVQGGIKGQFNGADGQFSSILKFGPQDYPSNYGARYWDVGFGLSAVVPGDSLLGGNRVSVEWLQPVHTDVNGYQLDRDGALSATWSYKF